MTMESNIAISSVEVNMKTKGMQKVLALGVRYCVWECRYQDITRPNILNQHPVITSGIPCQHVILSMFSLSSILIISEPYLLRHPGTISLKSAKCYSLSLRFLCLRVESSNDPFLNDLASIDHANGLFRRCSLCPNKMSGHVYFSTSQV